MEFLKVSKTAHLLFPKRERKSLSLFSKNGHQKSTTFSRCLLKSVVSIYNSGFFKATKTLVSFYELSPATSTPQWTFLRGYWSQGAPSPFDLLKKFPIYGTCVFLWEITWGSMFTKVIFLRMVESIYCFWKKTFWLLNKVHEGGQIKKSLLKRKCGKNK